MGMAVLARRPRLIDARLQTLYAPPQEALTSDGRAVRVTAEVAYRVADPRKTLRQVENYRWALEMLLKGTIAAVVGGRERAALGDLRALRSSVLYSLRAHCSSWGLQVFRVDLRF